MQPDVLYPPSMTDRGYGRISLDTERSGSITKQRARIEGYAGGEVQWYEDSVSGSKVPFIDRPAGGRLMADLRAGDRVLITKIDRAARSVTDLLGIVKTIEASGASVVFVDQNIDTSGPMGRFILVLLAAIAELEAAIIAERRRESLEQFAAEGRHAVGSAPFGFHSIDNPLGRGLVIRPHPEQGPLLKYAIERVTNGETQEAVAESIGMSKSGFYRLLTSPRLAGMTPKGEGVVTIDGIPRIDPEAAILTMVEWSRLQAWLADRRTKGTGWNKHDGIGAALQCSVCGDRLYFQAVPGKPTWGKYRCRRVRPEHNDGTPGVTVLARLAEAHVEKVFLDRLGDSQVLESHWEGSAEQRLEAVSVAKVRLQDVRRRQDAAITDDEEEALMVEYRAAKRALREAEDIPVDQRLVTVNTGETQRDRWHADGANRVALLMRAGQWMVQPGRLPIEDKVLLVERRPDLSGIMAGLSAP